MGSEWITSNQIVLGDTIRLETGELIENIQYKQIKEVQGMYAEVEVLY
ncbi:MAG: hypothetical protein ACRDD7_08520 [Peptostreptococcaceae bacterium]